MEDINHRPKVGVGVIIFKDGKVLVGKRKASHGAGEYAFPGGHLEYMESFEDCAKRETMEECGIKIKNVRFLNVSNLIAYNPKHYVNIQLIADWESGEPQDLEPEKVNEWQWFPIDEIPGQKFIFSEQGIESIKTGRNYFDIEK